MKKLSALKTILKVSLLLLAVAGAEVSHHASCNQGLHNCIRAAGGKLCCRCQADLRASSRMIQWRHQFEFSGAKRFNELNEQIGQGK